MDGRRRLDSVVVVGAGAFGAALAWRLAGAGVRVTLVDQFEPGDERASSGGETRLLRCAHGADEHYSRSARRSRALWRELEAETGESLYLECGVAWFAQRADGWEAASERVLRALGIPAVRAEPAGFPSVATGDLAFTLLEPEAGVVRAQRAVRALAARARALGATLLRGRATPEGARVRLADGRRLEGDAVVWACGAWLPELFPQLVTLRVTRQDLLFFAPGRDGWWGAPAWVDYDAALYGTGDVDGLGCKAALDAEGPLLGADEPLPGGLRDTEPAVRAYLARRFPALAAAPLQASRSCRYELTPDSHFLAAPHPEHAAVWLLGGGSGHGFKHAPALAEHVAAALRGDVLPLPQHALGVRSPARSLRTAGSSPRALARQPRRGSSAGVSM